MTRSVYIVGAAGTGKSTFTAELLSRVAGEMGPLIDLHSLPNKKALVTLRGHEIAGAQGLGLYLGLMRDSYPGTDGLDRASSPVGAEWLGLGNLPDFIISEGLTLCTKPFIDALAEHTEMMLVHLHVDPMIQDLRFLQRGSMQDERFVKMSGTRSDNMLVHVSKKPNANFISFDTDDPAWWDRAVDECTAWLEG